MKRLCDSHEQNLSALIDGELDPLELPASVDHLVECASCREFYRAARALERRVLEATAPADLSTTAPERLWSRIEAAASERAPSRGSRIPGVRAWGGAVAAALVLSAALWLGLERRPTAPLAGPAGDDRYVEVVLGQDRGEMSERRFVELTTELLRADGRYHRKMREVLELVNEQSGAPEGSSEDRHGAWLRDGDYRLLLDRPRDEGGEPARLAGGRTPV